MIPRLARLHPSLLVALATGLLASLACDPAEPSVPGEQPTSERLKKPNGSGPDALSDTPDDSEAPPIPVALELGSLPPISFDGPTVDEQRRSRELSRTALHLLEVGKPAAAAETLADSVNLDPGHVLARYNLAGALEGARQHEMALAVLTQLDDASCPHCLGQLVVADSDETWEGLRRDDRFQDLVRSARERLEPVEDAGLRAGAFARDGRERPEFIDPRRPVSITVVAGGSVPVETVYRTRTFGAEGLEKWLAPHRGKGVLAGVPEACDERCCRFGDPEDGPRSVSSLVLSEVCFRVADDRAVSLRSVEFVTDSPDALALEG
jgi:hypothetical protein